MNKKNVYSSLIHVLTYLTPKQFKLKWKIFLSFLGNMWKYINGLKFNLFLGLNWFCVNYASCDSVWNFHISFEYCFLDFSYFSVSLFFHASILNDISLSYLHVQKTSYSKVCNAMINVIKTNHQRAWNCHFPHLHFRSFKGFAKWWACK